MRPPIYIPEPKDPDAVLNYTVDWSPWIGEYEITSAPFTTVTASGTVIDSQSNDNTTATFIVSGGVDGQTAAYLSTANFGPGLSENVVIYLPIVSSYTAPYAGGYTDPTASDFLAAFPEFSAVPLGAINQALSEARRMVDTTWTEGDYGNAQMNYAAHLLAKRGLGSSPDALSNTGQLANFETIRSAQLTLTRKSKSSAGATGTASWYMSTRYGEHFWMLLQQNRSGPRVAVAESACVSGYAKDVFWPWVY